MKAALVNLQTQVVENVIMVNSLEDVVQEGYKLVEVPIKDKELTPEELEIENFLKEIDPDYVRVVTKIERIININETQWSEESGFYGDGVQF